ncbi:MAG: relaxase domain-containing protein [Egibacteraceae bacterium]
MAVRFDHRTSRPEDPLLHTHMIAINPRAGRTSSRLGLLAALH